MFHRLLLLQYVMQNQRKVDNIDLGIVGNWDLIWHNLSFMKEFLTNFGNPAKLKLNSVKLTLASSPKPKPTLIK